MEMRVFFRGKPPAKAALARAMRQLGFPLTIPGVKGSLVGQSGYLPMKLRGDETGVEFDIFDDRTAIAEFAARGVDPSYERVANFRWGGDMQECIAALCGAAALAKLTDGVVFDEAEGKVLSVPEAIAAARQILETLPKPDKARRPGTRPADIKRYLKPLLQLRGDLALIERRLVIQPVRHLLRGAFFGRTSDPQVFELHWFIKPLHHDAAGIGGGSVARLRVDVTNFESCLFDLLAGEIFEFVGNIDSYDAYAEFVKSKPHWPDNLFECILLAGGIERANDYLNDRERSGASQQWLTEKRGFLRAEPSAVFAHYRTLEAKTVKALKVEHIWECSPFAPELSDTGSLTKSSESLFTASPWVDLLEGWRQDAPDASGDIRFGCAWWRRRERVFLITPLTTEEAAELHRTYENYVLATRLPDGTLLLLQYVTDLQWLRDEGLVQDEKPKRQPLIRFLLRLYSASGHLLIADLNESIGERNIIQLRSIDIKIAATWEEIWYSFLDFRDGEISIYDARGGVQPRERRVLTEADRSQYEFPVPRFADFESILRRVYTYLQTKGYGLFN